MRQYVPRSGWGEQKTSPENCCGKQQSLTLVNQTFDEPKIVVFALRRLGQNREAKRVRRSLPVSDDS